MKRKKLVGIMLMAILAGTFSCDGWLPVSQAAFNPETSVFPRVSSQNFGDRCFPAKTEIKDNYLAVLRGPEPGMQPKPMPGVQPRPIFHPALRPVGNTANQPSNSIVQPTNKPADTPPYSVVKPVSKTPAKP